MKKIFSVIFLLFIVCSVQSVASDTTYDYSFGGSAGYFGPLDSDYDGDFTIKGSFEAYGWEDFSLRTTLGFFQADSDGAVTEGSFDYLYANENLVYTFPDFKLEPYIKGGLGIYHLDYEIDDSFEFGINLGGGIEFPTGENVGLFVEGNLHSITGDGPDMGFATLGGVKIYY